jgi:hypothetical protein
VTADEHTLGLFDDGATVEGDRQVAGGVERSPVGLRVGDDDRTLIGEGDKQFGIVVTERGGNTA